MPSTATSRLRLEKQALGENNATWGAPKLNDALDRIDEAIGGVESIAIAGTTTTLSSANYSTDQSRKACLVFTGTLSAASTVVVPNAEKLYLCINNCVLGGYTLTIKTAAGAGVVLTGGPAWVYCNGTSVFSGMPRLDQLGTAGAALNMGGFKVTNAATPTATTDLATKAYVDGVAVGVDASAAVAALQASVDASLATLAPKASPTFTSSILLSTGTMAVPLGTASAPTYSFTGDSNTGVYSSGADSISLVAGGTARATATSSGLGVTGAVTATGAGSFGGTLGATGAATFGSTLGVTGATTLSSTLGVTSNATVGGTLDVTGAITATAGMTAAAPVRTAAGSVSAPSHSFSTDTNSGVYSGGADIVRIATGGADRVEVSAAGDVGIGITPLNNTNSKTLTLSGTLGGTIELCTTSGTIGPRLWGESTDNSLNLSSHNAAGKIQFRTNGGLTRTTIDSGGFLLHGQSSSTVPGYLNTTTGSSLHPEGRLFISAPSGGFSNWNLNADGALLSFCRSGVAVGGIAVTTTATAFNTSSDYRLKTDVEPLVGALDRLKALKPSRFRFKSEKANAKKVDGFMAHEVAQVVPEAVTGEKDAPEMQGLDKSRLVPLLCAAIQELVARVETLEKATPGKAK